ncbi:MAG: DUF3793 family protein [Faecalibacterium sp.]|nr:DUF3793 family protein [Ruminococcus sp.]MCM1392288.1 DUF3793 family protein [Ruminococcus sp.]MCM1486549.1 DUF3793 family protein [Faecalibacterium sp.]
MSEELLVRHCSPTLAGMKTGNIFNCKFEDTDEMKSSIRCWNRTLVKKGLRVLPLRRQEDRVLIYVYRPAKLSQDLKCNMADKILQERGYDTNKANCCILELIKRLKKNEDFPHEIGLFLGYPPEDVQGFIENRAADCKCVGCWKVYGDAESAQKLFAKYKKCTDVYCTMFANGRSVERLTVAV